mmetsp:Transcript_15840/g.40150  ORF Transcript_15840/g.40150 Transcript_15840/m.40150 type:complete len:217 (-) Transcript_15840:2129-2779(-)
MKKKKVLFGVPLEQIIKDKELSSDGIPKVVRECCEYLSKYALRTEGLFRVDGSEVEVQKLVNSYNAGKRTDLSKAKDHFVVGTLFKRFLGKLPQSLITKEFYEKAFEFRDAPIDEQVKGWRALLDAIDGGPRQIIKFVFAFLKNVERNEGFNMMSATNLGIVFGMLCAQCFSHFVSALLSAALFLILPQTILSYFCRSLLDQSRICFEHYGYDPER